MLSALTKSRSPEYHRKTMFKIIVIACLAGLFYTSVPARQITSDALQHSADFIRP